MCNDTRTFVITQYIHALWPMHLGMNTTFLILATFIHLCAIDGFVNICNAQCMVMVKWSHYRPGVAQRVGRGIALLFYDRGTRRQWVVSSTPQPHFTPGKDPVPIFEGAGWAPGPVQTGAENLIPNGIRSRTVQPIVSRYIDSATRTMYGNGLFKITYNLKCTFKMKF